MTGLSLEEAVAQLGALQRRAFDLFVERRRPRPDGQPTRLQTHVLLAIREKGGLQVSEIARLLEVSPATTSQLLTAMEEKGWLERTLVPNDRRRHRVGLTPAGEGVVREIEARRKERAAAVLAALSAEERAQLVTMAHRLVETIAHMQPEPGGGDFGS